MSDAKAPLDVVWRNAGEVAGEARAMAMGYRANNKRSRAAMRRRLVMALDALDECDAAADAGAS